MVKFAEDTKVNRSKTAIILVDFQNEFATAGGKLYDDVKDMMISNGMLEKVPKILKAARNANALVIYSPVLMKEKDIFDHEDYDPQSYGALTGLFTEGTWNSEMIDSIKPEAGEHELKNRKNFSAFRGTDLASFLLDNGIRQVYLMGFLTNVCIEETARDMVEYCPEIQTHVLTDGCAAKNASDQAHTIETVLPLYGVTCLTCDEAHSKIILTNTVERTVTEQDTDDMLVPLLLTDGTRRRPRILALSGAQSNSDVTRLQLQNLSVTEDKYDIIYLHGQLEVNEPSPELVGLVHGPFYSWFHKEDSALGKSIIEAVHHVLSVIQQDGPFDGIYGFSSGSIVATLVANIHKDPVLQDAVMDCEGNKGSGLARLSTRLSTKSITRALSTRLSTKPATVTEATTRLSQKSVESKRTSKRNSSALQRRMSGVVLGREIITAAPFRFAVLACSAFKAPNINELRNQAELPGYAQGNNFSTEEGKSDWKIETKSLHLVGIEDEFKTKSEEVLLLFKNPNIMYLSGGHSISKNESANEALQAKVRDFMKNFGVDPKESPVREYIAVSELSSIGLHTQQQIVEVDLKPQMLPKAQNTQNGSGATIISMLSDQPADKPFLYDARNTDSSHTTKYGELLDFIIEGPGDLRHLGVKLGEVVAYGAPTGGGAPAAVAFLSIGAQTTTAPLALSMTKPDVLDALEQFNAKHLIIFEGLYAPGIEAAFAEYAKSGAAVIHRARITNERPGLFEYVDHPVSPEEFKQRPPLANPSNGKCLLLRTSGTTARPKGVPLVQGALITNGAIIAKSMQLTENDVVYSVMPLFHIGGISASVLCTLSVGGKICCDAELFDPSRMVEALTLSNPQPTWYSSVPTIHNATVTFLKDQAASDPKYTAYGIDSKGVWASGHSLRMIRSGAAALLGPDGAALTAAYGGVPIYPTYSMSEQMPISQPPAGKIDTLTDKPGSVGVPVAASTAIVSRGNLVPQPYGVEGEIAISGPTVLKEYLENPKADAKAYFFLNDGARVSRYFLTGDVGLIDSDGFLSLKGRAKELIKKGGEQVSPFEVEEPLLTHPWVQMPVCFAVESKLYGEEVGCAIVLSSDAPEKVEEREVIIALRKWLKDAELAPLKWPTKWIVCDDSQLPKTKTKKYIRVGLAKVLGFDGEEKEDDASPTRETTAEVDWAVISGFRFCLACMVMFMHIGSNKSWGVFNNLRGFPWHVHVFFTLGGYSMASPMNPTIKKKFSYFMARIGSMYPMYAAALIFGLINLLIVCRPSTFSPNFHWDAQPNDKYLESGELAPLFCEGTPLTPNSYWASLILTIVTYIFGMAVTPFYPLSWFMGYYLWFSSMYYQCLAFFPGTYNYLFNGMRKKTGPLLKLLIALLVLNYIIMGAGWFTIKGGNGYNHYDPITGSAVDHSEYTLGSRTNNEALGFYLFGPFWALYFVIGMVAAFLYDAYRPTETHRFYIWGYIADACTLAMLGLSIAMICQGVQEKGTPPTLKKYMRPEEANEFTDVAVINRLWDSLIGRIVCPLTTLWIFALSTGQGITASILRCEILSVSLAPNSYNCFLFHQMVAQWYFAATRNGEMWNWWRSRKGFYWFSPGPCPVEWYEYLNVVVCVIFFSRLMDSTVVPVLSDTLENIKVLIFGEAEVEDIDSGEVLLSIVEGMTGITPELDWTLDECGLASIGMPVLVGLLNKNFSTKAKALSITPTDLVSARTILDMVKVVEDAKALAADQGV